MAHRGHACFGLTTRISESAWIKFFRERFVSRFFIFIRKEPYEHGISNRIHISPVLEPKGVETLNAKAVRKSLRNINFFEMFDAFNPQPTRLPKVCCCPDYLWAIAFGNKNQTLKNFKEI